MEEEEEALVLCEAVEEPKTVLEGALDVGVGAIAGVVELLEAPFEPVGAGHEAAFGETPGAEAA